MKKVLFVASVKIHIMSFHLPYLKWFKEQGYEVHVAANSADDCEIPNCDVFHNINFDRFPYTKNNIKAYNDLKEIIHDNEFNIIHCHTPVASVLTRLATITEKNTTVIYTAHGFHFYDGAPLLNWLIYYPVERLCARFTDKLITINTEDYERAKKWSLRNNGKVYYVPGVGVDFSKFNSSDINVAKKKRELDISEGTKVILSVGELNENKNHEVVIRALSELKNQNFIYLIAGKGHLKDYLEKLIAEKGLVGKVKLLGYRTDINELLKITDLFVFPSKREGLGLALVEAMAMGVNCIASDNRGSRDLLSAVDLFNPYDEQNVSSMIEAHLNSCFKYEYENLSKYSLENVMYSMLVIYEES